MRRFVAPIVGLAAFTFSNVQAADNGIYIGAGLGQAAVEVDDLVANQDFKGDDLGYKVIVGIRPLDWLGVEANYVNFGKPDDTVAGARLRAEGHALSAFAVGFLTLGPVDLFAKGGLVSWDSELSHAQLGRIEDDDGTDLAYGVGLQFRLLSLGVRAEYEVFDIDNLDDANMASISVTYTFL